MSQPRRMSEHRALGELAAVTSGWEQYAAQERIAWVDANQARWTEEYAKSFSADQRRKAAKEGAALPDGSYPIYSQADLDNAARLAGKGDASEDRVVAHIKKRAKQLGLKLPQSIAAEAS